MSHGTIGLMKPMRVTTHPGDILKHELKARGVSHKQFAGDLGLPLGTVSAILNRKASVTRDIAGRLSRYLGTSWQVWMNLQRHYDTSLAEFGPQTKSGPK